MQIRVILILTSSRVTCSDVHRKDRSPTCRVPSLPSREKGVHKVCGEIFKRGHEVYHDETSSVYLHSPNSTQNLRVKIVWELEMITTVQLKGLSIDIFYFSTDLSGGPKSREPLNLVHSSSRFSAHHGVECNPTHTWITLALANRPHYWPSQEGTYNPSIFIPRVYCLRHWQYTSHCCTHIEACRVKMMHAFYMFKDEHPVLNRLIPNLNRC